MLGAQYGLSSPKINNTIAQDDKGFIWIGTEDGLNKYDGSDFTVYKKINGDSTSIKSNIITSLFLDSENRLWIGSMMGLQYYDPEMDRFRQPALGNLSNVIQNKPILWIMEDSRNNIWFSVETKGVVKYSLDTKKSVLYKSIHDGGYLCSYSIRNIIEDNDGNIWFSSLDNGITIYNPNNDGFYQQNRTNSNLSTDAILRIAALDKNNMLISTLDDGIYIFEKQTNQFRKTKLKATAFAILRTKDNEILIGTEGEGLFRVEIENDNILYHPTTFAQIKEVVNSKIHCLYEDRNGNLWIAMYNDGIGLLKRYPAGFTNYSRDYNNSNSLSYGQVTGITTDPNSNIWFATDGGGLNKYDRKSKKYTHYRNNTFNKHSLSDDAVVDVFCDKQGTIWAGTYTGGLCKYNNAGGFISYKHSNTNNSPPGNYVKCITEDSKNNLWLGTDGTGISYFNPKSGIFKNYSKADNNELVSDYITFLYLQNDSLLWIGSHFGISAFNIDSNTFKTFRESHIHNTTIFSIAEDHSKNLWIGTPSGLYKYDQKINDFLNDNLPDDLKNIAVMSVVPYKDELWLATGKGIICYNLKEEEIVNYISNLDLGGTTFIRSAYYLSPHNEIFFGGGNGCYSLCPDKMDKEIYSPNVYITQLAIFNEPILVGKAYNGRAILNKSLEYTDHITLKHSENNFTLKYSSPGAPYPASISYRCMMEGVDVDWIAYTPSQQSVTYANLSPGTYTFKVYASNISNPSIKNITKLTIKILPPIWFTWWAKLIYVLLLFLLLYTVMRFFYVRIKEKNELNIERLKVKKQEELNINKMQFFTNISHEFKTPLTLIISPLRDMQQTEENKERAHLIKVMLRNADRLQRLINQILDLRKAEYDKIEIRVHPLNIISFVQNFLGLFSDIIQRKNIAMSFSYDITEGVIYYDPDLLEKCLYNLLFNALKFTPDGGKIHISIEQSGNDVLLSIKDNGCGISKEDIPFLFDRFYQGPLSKSSGTGIGLHLVKIIVELHLGSITVDSEVETGSCFTILIKGGKGHFLPENYDEALWEYTEYGVGDPVHTPQINEANQQKESAKTGKPCILLVEDDIDMRIYIQQQLSVLYDIVEVSNGRKALTKLQNMQIDLIISDVMMPEMSGIEFTRIVKENIDTCHIPVILLTAADDIEHKLEGVETGADSYITKPFNMDYLQTRIKKILELRKKLQTKFSQHLNMEASEIEITNTDERLVQDCISYIRNNISEPDLTVELLAKKMNVSRTNLHRKVKIATGNTPIELIRIIRMKQAAYLLEKGILTVSEVAYGVGYNSLSYFSTSFTQYWGVSPSVFIQNRLSSEK